MNSKIAKYWNATQGSFLSKWAPTQTAPLLFYAVQISKQHRTLCIFSAEILINLNWNLWFTHAFELPTCNMNGFWNVKKRKMATIGCYSNGKGTKLKTAELLWSFFEKYCALFLFYCYFLNFRYYLNNSMNHNRNSNNIKNKNYEWESAWNLKTEHAI